MPADLVDKIYIGYNAPYAVGNLLAPQAFEPIMPKMVEDKKTRKMMNFVGVMSTAAVATHVVSLSADKPTKAKLDVIAGASTLGVAGFLANFDSKTEFGGPAPDAFKWGNVAANAVLGAALIKKGMDNM